MVNPCQNRIHAYEFRLVFSKLLSYGQNSSDDVDKHHEHQAKINFRLNNTVTTSISVWALKKQSKIIKKVKKVKKITDNKK